MIDYKILADSLNFYEKEGYTRIEAPWTVSEYVDKLTKPKDTISFQLKHNDKCLVASGEQSFLYLHLKNFLPEKSALMTITPCYRYENFDYTHTKYFMKNELIRTDIVNNSELDKMVDCAYRFFSQYLPNLDIITTDAGYDIEYKGTELGSYGIRECDFLKWCFGTGCPEPRLSNIIKLYKNGLS